MPVAARPRGDGYRGMGTARRDTRPPRCRRAGAASTVDAADWRLERLVAACTACDLHRGRQQPSSAPAIGRGADGHRGRARCREEDRQGEPSSAAPSVLNAMLGAIGSRAQVYIANIVKCRPPAIAIRKRPRPRPVAFISNARSTSSGRARSGRRPHRGQNLGVETRSAPARPGACLRSGRLPVVVTYHPAYLLRKPADKGKAARPAGGRELLDGGVAS